MEPLSAHAVFSPYCRGSAPFILDITGGNAHEHRDHRTEPEKRADGPILHRLLRTVGQAQSLRHRHHGKNDHCATGLKIDCLLPGSTGGEQQVAARVAYNEIDLVLMFRDPMEKYQNDTQINDLLRSCDQNCIPVATNVATAEVLIQGLARGDLAWREIDPKATF